MKLMIFSFILSRYLKIIINIEYLQYLPELSQKPDKKNKKQKTKQTKTKTKTKKKHGNEKSFLVIASNLKGSIYKYINTVCTKSASKDSSN